MLLTAGVQAEHLQQLAESQLRPCRLSFTAFNLLCYSRLSALSLAQVEYSKQLNESRIKVLQAREDAVQVRPGRSCCGCVMCQADALPEGVQARDDAPCFCCPPVCLGSAGGASQHVQAWALRSLRLSRLDGCPWSAARCF